MAAGPSRVDVSQPMPSALCSLRGGHDLTIAKGRIVELMDLSDDGEHGPKFAFGGYCSPHGPLS
jgi:hypothetical protein